MIRRPVGRVLQALGLVILPFGMASQLFDRVGEGGMLLIAAGGAGLFYVGYLLQHRP